MLLFLRMEHMATMILHHGGYFKIYDIGNVEYLDNEFCFWEDVETHFPNKLILEYMINDCRKYMRF